MADFVYDDGPGQEGRGAATRRLVNLTGAAVSTALVIGMGVWGYKLMVRDVSGIPVIEAIDGAFRTQPEDPGGLQAPHQGLQVNEIAAGGIASETAEEVVLAPDPEELTAEDAPMGDLEAPSATAQVPQEETVVAVPTPSEQRATGADPEAGSDVDPTDRAVAEALAALDGGDPQGDVSALAAPRPVPRPGDAADGTVGLSGDTLSDPAPAERVAVDALPDGTRLVQLGAFESRDVARDHWSDVGARFTDAFAGKRMVVQEATSGGQPFYRLRAEGFSDLAEAQEFCSTLLAGRADCIPVELQ